MVKVGVEHSKWNGFMGVYEQSKTKTYVTCKTQELDETNHSRK